MNKLFRVLTVAVLSASLMLAGPLSAIAITTPAEDAAVVLTAVDLTAELEAAANDAGYNGVSSVINVTGFLFLMNFVTIVDNDGKMGIFATSGEGYYEEMISATEGMDHINDVAFVATGELGSPYVQPAGPLGAGTMGLAIAGDIGGQAILRIVDFDLNKIDILVGNETTLTSVAWGWSDANSIAMTLPTGYALFDWTDGITIADTEPMSSAANVVEGFFVNISEPGPGVYFTGTHDGRILIAPTFDDPQEYLISPDITEVQSIAIDWINLSILSTGLGSAGKAKMFELAGDAPGTEVSTELNLPPTIESKAILAVNSDFNVTLVGGTGGGAAHLYKRRPAAGEFINLDYMVSGMETMNDLYCSQIPLSIIKGTVDVQTMVDSMSSKISAMGFEAQESWAYPWLIGGSGSTKLVGVTATPLAQVFDPAVENSVTSDAGGAGVTLPAGSVPSAGNYDVLVEKVASGTPAVPGGLSLLGASYDFRCWDADGNPVTEFDAPVTITISYEEANLNGMSEDSLVIYWYNPDTSAWEAIVPSVVDKVNNTVTIQVSHFSQFGILGVTASAMPYTGQ